MKALSLALAISLASVGSVAVACPGHDGGANTAAKDGNKDTAKDAPKTATADKGKNAPAPKPAAPPATTTPDRGKETKPVAKPTTNG